MNPASVVRAFAIGAAALAASPALAEPTWITCTITQRHLQGGGVGAVNYALGFVFDEAVPSLAIAEASGEVRRCEVMGMTANGIQGACLDWSQRRRIFVSIRRGTGRIELQAMNGSEIVNFPWEGGSCAPRQGPPPTRKF